MPKKKKKLRNRSKKKILELKPFLDEMIEKVEVPDYIDEDPVQFMHAFDLKQDQEIAGFYAGIMAWGRRDIVVAKVNDLLRRMDYRPYDFVRSFDESDAEVFKGFKHRTFKPVDMYWFTRTLQVIINQWETFEDFWSSCYQQALEEDRDVVAVFNDRFFSFFPQIPQRCHKHIANPERNSSTKRLYMYLRWCIRKDSPVDPGIMNFMSPAELKIPLDVHVARQARRLGLLSRRQNDWKAVLELNDKMKLLDPDDPAKYDYALFGIGVLNEELPEAWIYNKNVD
ncbi:TIGR02757 family protein [Balneola sp. MJW-20]|uniref:TIGR02757 family protein n=1 Tax=Gracilimonas aurantiaca TaxID=3234185 RepID=UPI0034669971